MHLDAGKLSVQPLQKTLNLSASKEVAQAKSKDERVIISVDVVLLQPLLCLERELVGVRINMAKVISVVGARPNFVKLSALEPYLRGMCEHIIIHTGQHYDYELSKVFFEDLALPEPDYFLGVGSGSHGYQVGEIIKRTEKALLEEKPDAVIVYGDTNSTLGGALAAIKAGFKVVHVEAGLRSYDMSMPEEINRRVVDHVSWLLFAPTANAVDNLRKESVPGRVYLTGDVHVDVLLKYIKYAEERSGIVNDPGLSSKEYILVTVHRAENTDNPDRLKKIVKGLLQIQGPIVFPIHPRTEKALKRIGLYEVLAQKDDFRIIKPLGYLDFIYLLKESKAVVTDSGGVQREAYVLGVPCFVLRDRTEWVELVKHGYVKLVEEPENVAEVIEDYIYPETGEKNLLGDGFAGQRMVEILFRELGEKHSWPRR